MRDVLSSLKNVNEKTSILGLLGQNIGYSKSPALHNFSIKHLGLDATYLPFDVASTDVPELLVQLWQRNCDGLNVTTPHKKQVAGLTNGHGLSSVNTLYRGKSDWQACSTDIEGLANAVARLGCKLTDFKRFVILGNGGVVDALLDYIGKNGKAQTELTVLRRDGSKDTQLGSVVGTKVQIEFGDFTPKFFSKKIKNAKEETLIVQATNAPHKGDLLPAFADELLGFSGTLVDLTYGKTSALLAKAKSQGLVCQDGLPMLIEQARLAQMRWWGKAAPYQLLLDFVSSIA